jgi:hypothetical protein
MGNARLGFGSSRMHWQEVPLSVRQGIERLLGAPVVRADTQPGGFSPGLAARVLTSDGHRFFVKAGGSEPNPATPGYYRAEAAISGALPPHASIPRLLATYDRSGWVALIFEDVDGRPPRLPWVRTELDKALAALHELARSLTPSPVRAPTAKTTLAATFTGWRNLLAAPELAALLDDWSRRHLRELAAEEPGCGAAASGDTLAHLDIRADNLIMSPDRVYVVDWPHASVGAAWLDLLLMLPSVAMQHGPDPWEIFEADPLAATADSDAVTLLVAGVAGFYLHRSLLPAPPGGSNVREFQRLQGHYALSWLKQRMGAKP